MTVLQKRLADSSDLSRISLSGPPNKKQRVTFALYSAIDMLSCLSLLVCSKCIYFTANLSMSCASTPNHAVRFSCLRCLIDS